MITRVRRTLPSAFMPQPRVRLKKVLFVMCLDSGKKFGSIEEQVLSLALAFQDQGSLFVPVYLFPPSLEVRNRYTSAGLTVEALDLRQLKFKYLRQLVHLIHRYDIEVINWNFFHPFFNSYVWLLRLLTPRVEHYFTDHDSRLMSGTESESAPRIQLKSMFKRLIAPIYCKYLCISNFVQACWKQEGIPNVQRVFHFVNTDRFRPDYGIRHKKREELGVGDAFVALIVAQLIEEKGVAVAIRALAEVRSVVLWVIGEGPEMNNLQVLARNLGVNVQFFGLCQNVEPFMQAADCLICPSLWAEAAGLCNLEALACGLPVIASRIGGIPEFVEDHQTGFLFAPGDHRELADRLNQLIIHPQILQHMSQQARFVAIERFSTQSQIINHLNLYKNRDSE